MYSYTWDAETNGFLLNLTPLKFSREPRPVYYQELDILGFDKCWNYEKDETYPYMWAEAGDYFYKGRRVAKVKGGSLYKVPEINIIEDPEPNNGPLQFVDIKKMVEKNRQIMNSLALETIKNTYNIYNKYKNKVDVFYVAFSGGKDSIVALDIVQKALPHEEFKVMFGDTGMEFPDTYDLIDKVENYCQIENIDFERAKSTTPTEESWNEFGPPAVTIRWCCSVRKSAPQILRLREILHKENFRGMAFTGIRGDESLSRNEYDEVSFGKKIKGQFSCHPILQWNSAELFNYIYQEGLLLNEAYKKGNTRAGCLVCPMSSGRHEYMKHVCYGEEVDKLTSIIKNTSGKTHFDDNKMMEFIDGGKWKTRKSGRELNFGTDKHITGSDLKNKIRVFSEVDDWTEWAKTLGTIVKKSDNQYQIEFKEKIYDIYIKDIKNGKEFEVINFDHTRNDVKFFSLFKSVIIKSTYCVRCKVCEAECPYGCIDMSDNGLKISDHCRHCFQCHDIRSHCLRYDSIRNRIGGDNKMKKLGRFYSFGARKNWMDLYLEKEGKDEFWDSDGDGEVGNKKKDAFLNFLKDSNVIEPNRKIGSDKYTRNQLTKLGKTLIQLKNDDNLVWSLMLCNLSYGPDFNWFVKNVQKDINISSDEFKMMLSDAISNVSKSGVNNEYSMFKNVFTLTPIGEEIGLANCVTESKSNGLILKSFKRSSWKDVDPRVILYSLYLFAEHCGDYYAFTLNRLMDYEIKGEGVSPTQIFGISKEDMVKILNGLTINYPEFINASFTLNLDNITLREDKSSDDVLDLFE